MVETKLVMERDEIDLKEKIRELRRQAKERKDKEGADLRRDELKSSSNAVYIWNLNKQKITENQLIAEFSKFGVIKKNQANLPKCKLYRDDRGKIKGDALIIYARHESVPIAIEMMDGYKLNGTEIKVEEAQFQHKKHKLEDSDDEGKAQKLAKHHSSEDNDNVSGRSAVVIQNILHPSGNYHEQELDDIKRDIVDGCLEIGRVLKIDLNSVTGKAKVYFENESSALHCCERLNGRYFDGRRLLVSMNGDRRESSVEEN